MTTEIEKIVPEVKYNTLVSIKFIVKAEDEEGKYNWEEAKSLEKDGWRLPTINELLIIHENKDNIGGFCDGCYWSSSECEYNNYDVRFVRFSDGSQGSHTKYYTYNVRLVKDI